MSAATRDASAALQVEIRELDGAHLDAMHGLECAAYVTPWSRAMFASELSRAGGVALGAFDGQALVGHLVASRLSRVWHVMNVAVHPEMRRQRLASRLIDELFARSAADDDAGYTLEVRVSNVAAIELYRAHGFRARGIRPGYYVDNHEDALVLWRAPHRLVVAAGASGGVPDWEPSL